MLPDEAQIKKQLVQTSKPKKEKKCFMGFCERETNNIRFYHVTGENRRSWLPLV